MAEGLWENSRNEEEASVAGVRGMQGEWGPGVGSGEAPRTGPLRCPDLGRTGLHSRAMEGQPLRLIWRQGCRQTRVGEARRVRACGDDPEEGRRGCGPGRVTRTVSVAQQGTDSGDRTGRICGWTESWVCGIERVRVLILKAF